MTGTISGRRHQSSSRTLVTDRLVGVVMDFGFLSKWDEEPLESYEKRKGIMWFMPPNDHSDWASQAALVVKNLPGNAGDAKDEGAVPRWGRSPGIGNGNLLQYFCLENWMHRGAWWATVHGITKSQILLRDWENTHTHGTFTSVRIYPTSKMQPFYSHYSIPQETNEGSSFYLVVI